MDKLSDYRHEIDGDLTTVYADKNGNLTLMEDLFGSFRFPDAKLVEFGSSVSTELDAPNAIEIDVMGRNLRKINAPIAKTVIAGGCDLTDLDLPNAIKIKADSCSLKTINAPNAETLYLDQNKFTEINAPNAYYLAAVLNPNLKIVNAPNAKIVYVDDRNDMEIIAPNNAEIFKRPSARAFPKYRGRARV